ncbi:MAG: CDP-alcohol phosphatidyltransferase family protein [Chloroflexota bacterium]|nr:CDP-alcohol phosphatidyltransferase family protein [Chloroflexota bacterium]
MSASQPRARIDLAGGDSFLPTWIKEGVRALLTPVVGFALRRHITANTITVVGLLVVVVAALLVARGALLVGAAVLIAGSLLDAVDGALARASGGSTAFGGFLDSTLDRAAEGVLFTGIAIYHLTTPDPELAIALALVAMTGSFMVSYTRARAEGLGYAASIGLAPRPERLVLVSAGLILSGIGLGWGLPAALALIGLLTTATVLQRIWHVWRQAARATREEIEP